MKTTIFSFSAFLFLALALSMSSCGSSADEKYMPFPADKIAQSMDSVKNFSVILYDMDVKDKKYYHKYKVIQQTAEIPAATSLDSTALADSTTSPADLGIVEKITDWKEVSPSDFDYHSSNMGMEIMSKKEGDLTKVAAPPGYSQYVGNSRYGQWKTNPSTGDSFWAFYGRYMFLNTMFNLMSPVRYGGYSSYYGGYYGRRPYYGSVNSSGKYRYGTGSAHAAKSNPSFAQRMKSNSALKSRVNNSISRSSARATGGKRSSVSSSSSRRSRSSSRYSSGSSSRSRSSSRGGK